ncbi:MAG: sugar ABC transporter permease [Spirochaetales bacterium]|nr:sugar ABC transporter permease [Spirochaetales bacterium]
MNRNESITGLFKQNMRQYAILIALITIVIIFGITTGGTLLRPDNLYNLIFQNSYILILATGMILCILSGGNIDLSVGSVVAFVSASSALFSVTLGIPPLIAVFLGLGMGLLAGAWHGFLIAYVRIPMFIATLAGMLIFRGLNNLILNGETIGSPELYITIGSDSLPDLIPVQIPNIINALFGINIEQRPFLHFTTIVIGFLAAAVLVLGMFISRQNKKKYNFSIESFGFFAVKTGALFLAINLFTVWLSASNGLPNVLILLTGLVLIYAFLTTKTVAGRHIYALGGNEKAAALSGIKTRKVLFWVYANMGIMAAVAGIAYAGRLNAFSPLAGEGFELDAIAACFIGGASAKGGVGTVVGAIIGGLIMGILNQGMSIMGINIFVQAVVKGLVLLGAVAFDVLSKNKQGA